jgi:dihydrofolate reductase/thymidylate synthase
MKYNIIVSLNNHNLIGENDQLLIHSKKDLKNFQEITTGGDKNKDKNIVIMGYKTWLSIPEGKRPLKDRINIVLTRNHTLEEIDDVKSFKSLEDALFWSSKLDGEIFVIGGTQIFNECCKEEHYLNLDKLYITRFNDNYHPRNSTHSFPLQLFNEMKLVKQSGIHHEICERPHLEMTKSYFDEYHKEQFSKSISFTFDIYQRLDKINMDEYQYLDLLKKVLKEGQETESRNSKVYSLFGERMIFNLQNGFPLLTTKQVGYKTILRELLWFINGSTSNKELTDKKVHIWTQNSSREFLDSRNLNYEEGDLGPVYGFQWRHFGAEYIDKDTDYSGKGVDQLQNVIDLIKNEPTSRRIIMNSWNASDLDKMALPPCHVMCQFNVNVKERTLDCQLYQRSGDMFLGVPFNIASYAFLTHIIARITGYQVGRLIHVLGDTHIYESHLEAVKKLIERIPNSFPELSISDAVTEVSEIDDIKEEYFTIKNYHHHGKITVPMIA